MRRRRTECQSVDLREQIGRLLTWAGQTFEEDPQFYPVDFLILEYKPEDVLHFLKSGIPSKAQYIGAGRYYTAIFLTQPLQYFYPAQDAELRQAILKAVKGRFTDEYYFERSLEEAKKKAAP